MNMDLCTSNGTVPENGCLKNFLCDFYEEIDKIPVDQRITYLTKLYSSLLVTAHDAAAASSKLLASQIVESNLATDIALGASNLIQIKLKSELTSHVIASNKLAEEVGHQMELERQGFRLAAVNASNASSLLLKNLQLKYEAAAMAAAQNSVSSLDAQRVASQLATEEAEVEANSRMTTEQNAAKRAAVLASEASDTKFLDQKSRFEAMAVAAADASDSSMIAERFASQLATEVAELEANSRMAMERNFSKQAALIASEVSASKFLDQRLMYEAAATAAADASDSSLSAERFASQAATQKAVADANTRMAIKRQESAQATLIASEASSLLLKNLQLKYEAAATAAANASDSSLSAQRVASQLATEEAEVEANSRMTTEQNAAKRAAVLASEASDTKFLDQKSRFEAMAVAAADASDSSMIAERIAAQLATEMAELEANSRMAMERNSSKQAALIASEVSASKFLDQRLMYEAAATAAADASDSSLSAERFASQVATEKAVADANTLMAIKRLESAQATLVASEASSLLLKNLQLKYEAAATAAADLSDSSLTAQRLASQLAIEQAILDSDLRMKTERSASRRAALLASKVSDTKFLDQKSRYEIAAVAAADASDSKLAIEQALFEMATKLASDAFAEKLTDNTIKTERLELQAKFALMESAQLRIISANVAHDLKSPLHTLLIGLESMRSGNDQLSQVQYAEMLDTLNSACAFMTSAISRTIEFSKTSSGVSLVPSNASFNLQEALNNPIKWMKAMLPPDGRKSIRLEALPESLTWLITDKHWAEENLLCLLSNAIKYSNQGLALATVTLEGGMVRVTVDDTGIGIPNESKAKLFKQFSKVQSMAVDSTGLGLYSLSKRVEAIGGSCGVSDRADGKQGSSFWFTFPYRPDSSDDACEKLPVVESTGEIDVSAPKLRSLEILIVDDSTSVVKILSNKLSGVGHRVITACNGAEGLEKMMKLFGNLDVVFMDIQMPVMDGIEATKRYRQFERLQGEGKHLPIICSSANSGGEAEQLALGAGVDSFLPKPFTTAVLLGVIDAVRRGSSL